MSRVLLVRYVDLGFLLALNIASYAPVIYTLMANHTTFTECTPLRHLQNQHLNRPHVDRQ